MPVSPVQHSNHTVPVQPTPPVAPVKHQDASAEAPPKVKSANPPGVGTKVDIHA